MPRSKGRHIRADLIEVIVVDRGSRTPLEPPSTPLGLKVVYQEDRGFGLARARNNGANAATHDILVFRDGDMIADSGLLGAHARWHHVVSDIVTMGFRAYVPVDDLDKHTTPTTLGGCDESFTRYGGEDTEFAYRAYIKGTLLVPVRDTFAWHQGRREE